MLLKLFSKLRRLEELEREVKELKELAYRDKLTGLFNRHGTIEEIERFLKIIEDERAHATERKKTLSISTLALIFIDLDNFKHINDTYGHDAGDAVLKAAGKVLADCLRPSDIAGRWGGEEFVVALPAEDEVGAYVAAEHICKALREQKVYAGVVRIPLTASLGVTELQDGDTLDALVARGDKAMYKAKQRGKDQVAKGSEI